MTAPAPAQAAANAFVTGCVKRGLSAAQACVPPEGQLATVRGLWADVAQAAADAATEGSLRACGYTLADIGRFLEAEAAAQEPKPGPGEVVHARPEDGKQVTPCCGETPFGLPRTDRMTLDLSLATCGKPEPKPAPEVAAAMAESRRYLEALQIARSFLLDPAPSGRRRAIAAISKALEGK